MEKCLYYEFSNSGYEKMKSDMKKEKMEFTSDCIFYSGIGVLFLVGVLNFDKIIMFSLCGMTSKSVRWLVQNNII